VALGLTGNQTAAVISGVVGFVCLAVILIRAAHHKHPLLTRFGTDFFFWLGVIYLSMLVTVAIMYMGNFYGVKDRIPVILGGILPIGVPWFGAIGAVVISLEGLFQHSRRGDWDPTYSYWHLARPLFGAVLAIVAFFIFLLLIAAAGQTPAFATPHRKSPAIDLVVYYVIAFLVGYREETFRELVKRVTDLLFTKTQQPTMPGQPALTFEAGGSGVEAIVFGPVAGGTQKTTTVTISNTGTAPLTGPVVTVTTNSAPAGGPFVKGNDNVTGQGDLAPGEARTVEVTFAPPVASQASFSGEFTVFSGALPISAVLPLSGSGS
jgi:hypothetical protein